MEDFTMKFVFLSLRALGLSVLCAIGPVAAQETARAGQIVEAPMPGDGPVIEVRANPGQGTLLLAVGTRQAGDKLAVCGIWTTKGHLSSCMAQPGNLRRAFDASSVHVGMRSLVRGLNYAQKVEEAEFVEGTTARCKVTRFDWSPKYASDKVNLRMARYRTPC
jgi:hypothetical protein